MLAPLFDELGNSVANLIDGISRGIDFDGVFGFDKRCNCAPGIGGIAALEGSERLVDLAFEGVSVDSLARMALEHATACPLARVGGEGRP